MADQPIDDLKVEISAPVSDFTSALDRAEKAMAAATGDISRKLEEMDRTSRRIWSKVGHYGAVAFATWQTVGRVMPGVVNSIRGAANEMGDLVDASERVGVSIEGMQELRFAAMDAGVGTDELSSALERLSIRMSDAGQGNKAAIDLFGRLGVVVRNNDGSMRSIEQVVADVSDGLARLTTDQDRLNASADLFGKSAGPGMVLMLKNGADGLDVMRQKARDLGVVINEDVVRGADESAKKFDALASILDTQMTRALVTLAPALVGIGNILVWVTEQVANGIRGFQILSAVVSNLDTVGEFNGWAQEVTRLTAKLSDIDQQLATTDSRTEAAEWLRSERARWADQLEAARRKAQQAQDVLAPLMFGPAARPAPALTLGQQYADADETGGLGPPGRSDARLGATQNTLRREREAQAARAAADGVRAYIGSLEDELALLGADGLAREKLDAMHRAEAAARARNKALTADERAEIEALVEQIDAETKAKEKLKAAQDRLNDLSTGIAQARGLEANRSAEIRSLVAQGMGTPEEVEAMLADFDRLQEQGTDTFQSMADAATDAGKDMANALVGWISGTEDNIGQALLRISQRFAELVIQMQVIEPLFQSAFGGGAGGGSSNWIGMLGSFAGSFFGGGASGDLSKSGLGSGGSLSFGGPRAEGGPIDPGRMYLVGERGPELRSFDRSGSIIPADVTRALISGGRDGQKISVNISTPHARSFLENRRAMTSQVAGMFRKFS